MGCDYSRQPPPAAFIGAWQAVQGTTRVALILTPDGRYQYGREGPTQHLRTRGPINRRVSGTCRCTRPCAALAHAAATQPRRRAAGCRFTPQLTIESSPYPCACCTFVFQLEQPRQLVDAATQREVWTMTVDGVAMERVEGCCDLELLLADDTAPAAAPARPPAGGQRRQAGQQTFVRGGGGVGS